MKLLILLTLTMTTFTSFGNTFQGDFFYQQCRRLPNGQTKCENVSAVPQRKYQLTRLNQIRPNQCYVKDTSSKRVFFKVIRVANKTIFAIAQAVKKSNPRDFGEKIYVQNYSWQGDNFNETIQEFPCESTPSLADNVYLTKSCHYKLGSTRRKTYYCDPILPNRSIGEPSWDDL